MAKGDEVKFKFRATADVVDEGEGDAFLTSDEIDELCEEIETAIINTFKKVPWATEKYNSILLYNVEVSPDD